jgi:hypothetical protein
MAVHKHMTDEDLAELKGQLREEGRADLSAAAIWGLIERLEDSERLLVQHRSNAQRLAKEKTEYIAGQESAFELYEALKNNDGIAWTVADKWIALALKAAGMDYCGRCEDATENEELQANRLQCDEAVCNHCAGLIETERMSPSERRSYGRAIEAGVD